jgi:aminomethyltransferase
MGARNRRTCLSFSERLWLVDPRKLTHYPNFGFLDPPGGACYFSASLDESGERVTSPTTETLRKTALNAVHRQMGAKMVNFGGWDMPVEYSGILSEHHAVRTCAGLFDVSHMGEIEIYGTEALALVQHVTSNDAGKLAIGQIQYSGLLTEAGTFVDDILVHRFSPGHYFLCVNAGNQDGDFEYIRRQNRFAAKPENSGERYSQLAIQGPRSLEILSRLTPVTLAPLRYYHFTRGPVDGVECIIARTGYTGEDGLEIYFDPRHSEQLWGALIEAGKTHGMIPCGLGARNTLRLEAGMCLYGHEIDDTTTVWEASLGWICKLDKGLFLGHDALARQRAAGLERILVGFEMSGRLIARDGYPVYCEDREVGRVTSGSPSPFLKKNIGMAYVPYRLRQPGTQLEIGVRGQRSPAKVVPLPFYKRAK